MKPYANPLSSVFVLACVTLFAPAAPAAITVNLTAGANSGPWTGTAGTNQFNGPNNANASINGSIGGTGDVRFQANSGSNAIVIIDLAAAHSYDGNTIVKSSNARGGVRLQTNNALPVTTVLSLDNTTQGSGRPSWFDLNGFSQQVAGLGAQITSNYNAIINGNTSQAGTLTVANSDNFTFNQFLGSTNAMPNIGTAVPGDDNNFSLVKSGAGTLTLTRINSYYGDTTVNAGILSITNAYLADAAAVRMFGTAVFDLDFTGTDTVGGLFFDGLQQAEGTWGAIGSTATNQSTFFTGNGVLNVVPEPSAFALSLLGLAGLVLRRRR